MSNLGREVHINLRSRLLAVILLTFMMGLPSTCAGQTAPTNPVVIEVFSRSDSEQSQRAAQFLGQLQASRAGIEVRNYDVNVNREALVRLWQLSKRFGYEKAGVPAIYVADRLLIGFRDAQTTGREIEQYLHVEAFLRPGCRHCRDARRFLDGLRQRWPGLTFYYRDIVNDAEARNEANRLVNNYQVRVVSFPLIHVAGRLMIGYQGDEITGRQVEGFFQKRAMSRGRSGSAMPVL